VAQQPPVAVNKPVTNTTAPPAQSKPPVAQQPPVAVNKPVTNPTIPTTPPAQPEPLVLTNNATTPHYVAIVLNKVDPVYVNEARNAFNRYNREEYAAKGFTVNNRSVSDEIKLVLIGTFANANEAITYIDKTKKLAATEIVPWLPAAKYSFIIITDNNLQVLMNTKDVNALKNFLQQNYPGKF
jgi:cell division septation protein DedD